jgi:hypothetical protein
MLKGGRWMNRMKNDMGKVQVGGDGFRVTLWKKKERKERYVVRLKGI